MTHMKEQSWFHFIMVIRCLWFILLTTSSLVLTIILPSCWRVGVHSTRYLKSSCLLWPSPGGHHTRMFQSSITLWTYYSIILQLCGINMLISTVPSKTVASTLNKWSLYQFLNTSVLQILCLTWQRWRKGWTLMFKEVNVNFHPWPERLYRAWWGSCSIFLKCNQFLGTVRFVHHLLNFVWQCYIISWICDINMPFNT